MNHADQSLRNAPTYDRRAALHLFGGDESLFAVIGDIFISDWPEYRARMHAALAVGDAKTLRHVSHTVNVLVDYFVAEQTARAVRELEYAGRDGRLDRASELLGTAIAAVDELVTALKTDTPLTATPAPA